MAGVPCTMYQPQGSNRKYVSFLLHNSNIPSSFRLFQTIAYPSVAETIELANGIRGRSRVADDLGGGARLIFRQRQAVQYRIMHTKLAHMSRHVIVLCGLSSGLQPMKPSNSTTNKPIQPVVSSVFKGAI